MKKMMMFLVVLAVTTMLPAQSITTGLPEVAAENTPPLGPDLLSGLHIESRPRAPWFLPFAVCGIFAGLSILQDADNMQDSINNLHDIGYVQTDDLEKERHEKTLYGWGCIVTSVVVGVVCMTPVRVYVNERGDVLGTVGVKF